MKNPRSIDSLAAATARQAQSEMAMMQRDMRALRDNVSGLTRGIRAPVIRPKRGVIKGSRSGMNTAGFAAIGLAALIDMGAFGDLDIKSKGRVTIGGAVFSASASQTHNAGYDDSYANSGSFYTSDAQSAGQNLAALQGSQRLR